MRKLHWSVWLRLSIFALFYIPTLFAVFWGFSFGDFGYMNPFGRDYTLESAHIDIHVDESGRAYILEHIGYQFSGCYREVFRVPNISRTPSTTHPYILNVEGKCTPECRFIDRGYEFAGNFQTPHSYSRICDQDASFFVNYSISHGMEVGRDIVLFHYKIWGTQWEKTLQSFSGTIEFPEEPIEIYFNPKGRIKSYSIDGSTVTFEAERVRGFAEINAVFPKSSTLLSSGELRTTPGLSLASVRSDQQDYEFQFIVLKTLFYLIYFVIILLLLLFPPLIYFRFGREPKVNYHGIYEREPPGNLKPYILNSLMMGSTGKTDKQAIMSVLLDLIRRKHLSITRVKTKGKTDFMLKFHENYKDMLTDAEEHVFVHFYSYTSSKQTLRWSALQKTLKKPAEAKKFMNFATRFEQIVDSEYHLQDYFFKRGHKLFTIFGSVMLFTTLVLGLITAQASGLYPFLEYMVPLGIATWISCIVGILLPNRVFGRFTKKGYVLYLKTKNFKKFLTDFSEIKRYPPESIVLWEQYLVYATAFGVAQKTISHMKKVVDPALYKHSSLGFYVRANALSSFSNPHTMATSSLSSSGGGGAGGGFGGGGGGAR